MPIDQVVTIVSLGVGLVGAGFAVLMYFRPRKRIRLAYQTSRLQYFDEAKLALPNEAAMTFEGGRVKRLSKAAIVLWNAGTEVLRGEDNVGDDPIRLSIAGGVLLSHRVLKTTGNATQVGLTDRPAPNELKFYYDYLNPGDGAVVELLHSGTATTVLGSAKGLKDGPEDWGEFATTGQPFGAWLLQKVLWVLLPLFLLSVAYWYWVFSVKGEWPLSGDEFSIFFGGAGSIVGFMIGNGIGKYWHRRRRYPAVLIPD